MLKELHGSFDAQSYRFESCYINVLIYGGRGDAKDNCFFKISRSFRFSDECSVGLHLTGNQCALNSTRISPTLVITFTFCSKCPWNYIRGFESFVLFGAVNTLTMGEYELFHTNLVAAFILNIKEKCHENRQLRCIARRQQRAH